MKTQSSVRMLSVSKSSTFAKDIVFHPKQSLVLVSLGNGDIELWDFELGVLVETFREHTSVIRGLDFHPTQPLFASTDDSGQFCLWDFQKKQSVWSRHIIPDYVRGVHFHAELPWIALACDDHTVRILNWQSREEIYVLEAHMDYVMSARFHPTLDLLITASLDKTAKIWDFSGLRKYGSKGVSKTLMTMQSIGRAAASTVSTIVNKSRRGRDSNDDAGISSLLNQSKPFKPMATTNALERGGSGGSEGMGMGTVSSSETKSNNPTSSIVSQRLSHLVAVISDTPICLIAVLDHPDLVDWAEFSPHHTTFVATGCDDKTVRLWNIPGAVEGYNPESAASQGAAEFAVLEGHSREIIKVKFHPAIADAVFSSSDDGTVRVWSLTKAIAAVSNAEAQISGAGVTKDSILVNCGTGSNAWSVSAHPTRPIIGVAHANGFGVIRIRRERALVTTDAVFTLLSPGVKAPLATRLYSVVPINGHVCLVHGNAAASGKSLFAQSDKIDLEGGDIPYTELRPYFSLGERSHDPTGIIFNSTSTVTCPSFVNPEAPPQESATSAFIILYPEGQFELTTLPTNVLAAGGVDMASMSVIRGTDCDSAAFVSMSRFVTLSRDSGDIAVRSLKNEIKRVVPISLVLSSAISLSTLSSPENQKSAQNDSDNFSLSSIKKECPPSIFPAGPGRILLVAGDHIVLYDVHSYRPIAYSKLSTYAPPARTPLIRTHAKADESDEVEVLGRLGEVNVDEQLHSTEFVSEVEGSRRFVSEALWSPGQAYVAFQLSYGVFVLDKGLCNPVVASESQENKKACAVHSSAITSMVWAKVGPSPYDVVLLYTTRTHLHYLIPGSGEIGVVRTFGEPVTLISAHSTPNMFSLSILYILNSSVTKSAAQTTPQMSIDIRAMTFNASELLLKSYTHAGRDDDVIKVLKSGGLVGRAILNHLRNSASPELALMFVDDPSLKFKFALEAGDLGAAQQCAEELNQRPVWRALAEHLLLFGHFEAAAACFTRAADFNRLAFLYLVMGRKDQLRTLIWGALVANNSPECITSDFEKDGYKSLDVFRYALLNGDLPVALALIHKAALAHPFNPDVEPPGVVSQSNLDKLAMVSSSIHGITQLTPLIKKEVQRRDGGVLPAPAALARFFAESGGGSPALNLPRPPLSSLFTSQLAAQDIIASGAIGPSEVEACAQVPTWLLSGQWPQNPAVTDASQDCRRRAAMQRKLMEESHLQQQSEAAPMQTGRVGVADSESQGNNWDLAADFNLEDSPEFGSSSALSGKTKQEQQQKQSAVDGWGIEGGFDFEGLSDTEDNFETKTAEQDAVGFDQVVSGVENFTMPSKGQTLVERWSSSLSVVGDVVASGQIDQAMHLLRAQIGAVNFAPMKQYMLRHAGIGTYATLPTLSGVTGVSLPLTQPESASSIPLRLGIKRLRALVNEVADAMTAGAFDRTLTAARSILGQAPLAVVDTAEEANEVQEIINFAREYILAVKIETSRAAVGGSGSKTAALDQANLASLGTLCNVRPTHKMILLWLACKHCFGLKAYATVAKFCTALLSLANQNDISELRGKIDLEMVKKILRKCQMEQRDLVQLAFDPNDSLAVCATNLVAVPWSRALEGREVFVCPYCQAKHSADAVARSPVCSLCTISDLRAGATGLKVSYQV